METSDVCTGEKPEQSRHLDGLTTLPSSTVQHDRPSTCDEKTAPEMKPTSSGTKSTTSQCAPIRRRSQRNAKKLPTFKARKRNVETAEVLQHSSTEGSRLGRYVSRTAALGFTKTTPRTEESDGRGILQRMSATIPAIASRRGSKLGDDKSKSTKRTKGRNNKPSHDVDREAEKSGTIGCSMHFDKSGCTADRLSSDNAIKDEDTKEKARILRGPIYDVPQQKHWAESDELVSEKGGIREKLAHLKAWSSRARHNDGLECDDIRNSGIPEAPRRRSPILPIFRQF